MIPWLRFFASHGAHLIADAIEQTDAREWKIGRHYAICERLDLRVWHANQGYGFEVFLGAGDDGPCVIGGGPDGERVWHSFKRMRQRLIAERLAQANRPTPETVSGGNTGDGQ